MKTAIYPGSFDPVTLGHVNIIKRAAAAFDRVIVCVMVNAAKDHGLFTPEERLELLKKSIHVDNVEFDINRGLLAEYARQQNARVLVKGLRAVSDFEYEFMMALTNKKLNPIVETIFLASDERYTYLSSSGVKEIAFFGGDFDQFVPPEIREDLHRKIDGRSQ